MIDAKNEVLEQAIIDFIVGTDERIRQMRICAIRTLSECAFSAEPADMFSAELHNGLFVLNGIISVLPNGHRMHYEEIPVDAVNLSNTFPHQLDFYTLVNPLIPVPNIRPFENATSLQFM